MKIKLQTFGIYRQLGEQLDLTLINNAKISDLRNELKQILAKYSSDINNLALLESSKFATQTEILNEDFSLTDGAIIAIIPPVAGG